MYAIIDGEIQRISCGCPPEKIPIICSNFDVFDESCSLFGPVAFPEFISVDTIIGAYKQCVSNSDRIRVAKSGTGIDVFDKFCPFGCAITFPNFIAVNTIIGTEIPIASNNSRAKTSERKGSCGVDHFDENSSLFGPVAFPER